MVYEQAEKTARSLGNDKKAGERRKERKTDVLRVPISLGRLLQPLL